MGKRNATNELQGTKRNEIQLTHKRFSIYGNEMLYYLTCLYWGAMSFHKNVSRKENSIEIFNFGGACVSTVDDLSNHIQMTLGFFFLSGKYTQSAVENLAFHNPRLNFSKCHLYVCTVYGLLTWKTLSLGCRPIGVS